MPQAIQNLRNWYSIYCYLFLITISSCSEKTQTEQAIQVAKFTQMLDAAASEDPNEAIGIAESACLLIDANEWPQTLKIPFLYYVGEQKLKSGTYTEALESLKAIATIADKEKKEIEAAISYGLLGNLFFEINQPDSAYVYLNLADSLFAIIPDKVDDSNIHLPIGELLIERKAFSLAISPIDLAISAFEENKDSSNLITALSAKALIYASLQDLDQATYFIGLAEKILSSTKLNDAWRAYIRMGEYYGFLNDPRASYYLEKGLQISTVQEKKPVLSKINYLLGHHYLKRQQLDSAYLYLKESIDLLEESPSPYLSGKVLTHLADWALQTGQPERSEDWLKEAQSMLNQTSNLESQIDLLKIKAALLGAKRKGKEQNEVLSDLDSLKIIAESKLLDNTFELLQKARDQEKLSLENRLEAGKLSKKKEKITLGFIILTLVIAGGSIIIVFLGKLSKSQKEKLSTQEVLLKKYKEELKNKDKPEIYQASEKGNSLEKELNRLFVEEKIFLEPDLKVEKVTEILETNYVTIKELLKEKYNSNFTQYVNQFRVQYAKERLADEQFEHFTIEGVANLSGFGTKQNFYRAFQQITGVSPSEYRNFMLNREQ